MLGVLALTAPAAPSSKAPGFSKEPMAAGYQLALAPLAVYDRLSDLKMGSVPALPADERKLLSAVWERKTRRPGPAEKEDDGLLVDAMLFASGIEGAEPREKYRERFDELVVGARQAVKGARPDRERGERLMRFLHKGVMSKGYAAEQSSFAAVFDTGKFNCVSATALYYLVGSRLGLKLRPLSIPGGFFPGHAALDLVEGDKRIQVEPTNPAGFDWKAKGGREGAREVDGFGVAALIYSNRGVALAGAKVPRPLEAARCYLAALALDPASRTAANNLLAIFVNWGPRLTDERKFEDAVRALAFGLSVAPRSGSLHNNHHLAWASYIDATLAAGQDQDALKVIERAAKAVPEDKDFQSPSRWFVRLGEKRSQDKGWEAGLVVVGRGLKVLPAAEGKKLLAWRSGLFRRWSQSLLSKKDVHGSLKVLARAYALGPKDREVAGGIAYHAQEALRTLEEGGGRPAAIEHYEALRKQFVAVKSVPAVGSAYAAGAVRKLTDARKYQEALKAAVGYGPLVAGPPQRAELAAIVYDGWARQLRREKKWKAALEKYAEGLKAFPRQPRLASNAIALIDDWAETAIKVKDWAEAVRVYDVGLADFPGNSHLKHNRHYCEQMKRKR